jgi:hypothetical protein
MTLPVAFFLTLLLGTSVATFEGCADDGVDCCVPQEDGTCVIPATGSFEDELARTTNSMSLFAMHTPPQGDLSGLSGGGFYAKRQTWDAEYPLLAPAPEGPLTVDYSRHMPYAVSQGSCGSCVIFSFTTTALMYTNMFREEYGNLPPVRADYSANLECYDWDKWQFVNSHTWRIDATIVNNVTGENATTTEFKAEGGLGEALLARLNAAAGTQLTMTNLKFYTARSDGTLYIGISTEGDKEGVNPLLTKQLWDDSSLSLYSYNPSVLLTTTSGARFSLRLLTLRSEPDICDGAFYRWASEWQSEQQTKYNEFRRSTTPSTDIGHLPLTLQEGQPDVTRFGAPDRTLCNNQRVLEQRGGEPSVDHIVSMSSMATQLLDDDLQSKSFTELDVSIRFPKEADFDDPHWVSWVTNSSYNLMYALTRYGPVSAALNVCADFSNLRGTDIARDYNCTKVAGHQIVIAGFDFDPARPIWENYFIIVNSWGKYWGDNGVGRIAFGSSAMKYGVVPVYSLRVPEYPHAFSHDRFATYNEALLTNHVYRGSVTAEQMFEQERGVVPFPTGAFEPNLWRTDNTIAVGRGVLDPPVGRGRWFTLPTDGTTPARRRFTHQVSGWTSGKTMSSLPRLIAETVNVVVTVADEDMKYVRNSQLTLRVNVWSAYHAEGRPLVFPLGTITIDGGSFRQEACDGDMADCSRWLGAATFTMRPDIVSPSAAGEPTADLVGQMLPGDEWRAIEMFAEWSGKAGSKNVPLYYYGGSIRINQAASEYYGVSFLAKGKELTLDELLSYDDAAYGDVPASWRVADGAGAAGDEAGGLSTTAIIIIVGGSVCALGLCVVAACVGLFLARRASTTKTQRAASVSAGGRSRSHSTARSRRPSERRLHR